MGIDIYSIWVYTYIIKGTEGKEMTKAERKAIESYKKDLMAEGIEKEMAEVMAKAFFEAGIIKPVVNYN